METKLHDHVCCNTAHHKSFNVRMCMKLSSLVKSVYCIVEFISSTGIILYLQKQNYFDRSEISNIFNRFINSSFTTVVLLISLMSSP